MARVVQELSEYFNLPEGKIKQKMSMREEILELEYKIWRTINPDDERLIFYEESKFMLFSNAQDEIERDNDTDWQDMNFDLADLSYRSVLDFGCGIGSAGLNLIKNNDVVVYFIEPNQYSREFLRWRCAKQLISQAIILSNIPSILQVDLIIAWGVFEHIDDNEAARIFDLLLSCLTNTGKFFLKNFYNQTDDYLLHYRSGPKMQKKYQENQHRIIYARHSH